MLQNPLIPLQVLKSPDNPLLDGECRFHISVCLTASQAVVAVDKMPRYHPSLATDPAAANDLQRKSDAPGPSLGSFFELGLPLFVRR